MWRRWRDPDDRPTGQEPCTGVAEDAEAYLTGQLLARLVPRGVTPRPWAWLSSVARCSHYEMARIADRAYGHREETWTWARGELARQVMLRTSGRPDEVAALQREVLVPLELALGDDDIWPSELVGIALIEMELMGR